MRTRQLGQEKQFQSKWKPLKHIWPPWLYRISTFGHLDRNVMAVFFFVMCMIVHSWFVDHSINRRRKPVLSNTERCWYVDICDRGAFWKYRTSAASEVFFKSAEITNIYIHSRVRYDLYHMSLDCTHMDGIDRPNFDLLKGFFDSSSDEEKNDKIKSFIEASRANRDVRVWYKLLYTTKIMHARANVKGISRHMV